MKDDTRFATIPARLANRDALTTILDGIFLQHPTAHWLGVLGGIVPVAPVNDLAGALDTAGDMVLSMPHPERLDGERLPVGTSPALGADSDALLAEIGYDPALIASLRADGTV